MEIKASFVSGEIMIVRRKSVIRAINVLARNVKYLTRKGDPIDKLISVKYRKESEVLK